MKPTFLGGIGYCFGAKFAVQNLSTNGYLDAAAVAHPSFVSMEEVKAIKRPIIISAAETDQVFTPELRHQTEDELAKLKELDTKLIYSVVLHMDSLWGDIKINCQIYQRKGFGRSIGIFQECSSFGPLIIEMFMVSKM